MAWVAVNGPIPAGQLALHRCDNPPCVNPTHLFLGTDRDNVADKVAKRRHPHGETSYAKLGSGDVRRIVAALGGGARQADLAAYYHVSQQTISGIATGKRWKHLARAVAP